MKALSIMKTRNNVPVPATMRSIVMALAALAATANADEVTPPAPGDDIPAVIEISGDSTLTVPDEGLQYSSLTVSGSGKLTLAGTGRIATSFVTVSDGVALAVNGRLDSTSITVVSGGAVDLVNSRDAHSLYIAGTGIDNSGAAMKEWSRTPSSTRTAMATSPSQRHSRSMSPRCWAKWMRKVSSRNT